MEVVLPCIQSQLPGKVSNDLMVDDKEALLVQVHRPHSKPILLGCCSRPPNARIEYLTGICNLIDNISDKNKELFMLGDFNIDYLSSDCHLKKKLLSKVNTFNLTQVVDQPTRVFIKTGTKSSTCIDHIYTYVPEHCSKSISLSIGFSDHNLVAITRKIKVPKAGNKIKFG